ncbi:MAG: zinc-binding protein [Anaerolineae bacterium]
MLLIPIPFVKSKYCNICGRRIIGQGLVYRRSDEPAGERLTVCQRCGREAPRCAACQMPMSQGKAQGGLCLACQKGLPRCSLCGGPALGGCASLDNSLEIYCQDCFRASICDTCGRLCRDQGHRLHNGRRICPQCQQTAVYDPARASALFDQTIQIIQANLGLRLNVSTGFALIERNHLLALLDENGATDEKARRAMGLFRREGRKRVMCVERGLPQILMIQVMAHEYAHAWQGENCPLLRDPLTREGFAEWVAYKVLQAMGATKKMAVMERRGDLYGQGLRKMRGIEEQEGVEAVLQACRRVK